MRRAAIVVLLVLSAAAAAAAPWQTSGVADWTQVPAPAPEPTFRVPKARRARLANGMALVVIENHKLPLVAMTLVVPGAGSADDPAGKTGLASFTADLLDEGAGGMTALELADALDRLGATVSPQALPDGVFVGVSALAKNLDATLDLAARIVTRPAFDDKEAARVHGDRVTWVELRPDRPREVAGVVLGGALYGGASPYGHPGAGYLGDVKKLTPADARAFYEARWHPARMTLVVAGDVDPAALEAKLDATLGAWTPRGKKPAAAKLPPPARAKTRLFLVDRPGAEQSDVRIGLVGLKRTDKRYYDFEVMRTVLGDGFTSRLVQRLREQLGYTYGIGASMAYRLGAGPVQIGTAIFTPKTVDGLKEILALVGDLARTDVPAEELKKAKQNLMRALPQQFETNEGIAGAFADLALFGLPDDWYEGYARRVDAVTAKRVRAAAKALLPENKLVFVVVGDMATVRAGLETLGLGAPVVKGPSGE